MEALQSLESWLYSRDIKKAVSWITGATVGVGVMAMVCISYKFEIGDEIEKNPVPIQFDEKTRENQLRRIKESKLEYALNSELNSVLLLDSDKYQRH